MTAGDDEQTRNDPPHTPPARDAELDHEGIAVAIITEWTERELPLLLTIKQELDAGRELSDGELVLMQQIVAKADELTRLAYLEPDASDLAARMIDLVHDITGEAIANEDPDTE